MAGSLKIVGTPIGNLKDSSFRAIETLKEVDFILAEDTRVTLKLLNKYNIKKHLVSYHEHNKNFKTSSLIERLKKGEKAAIVSDAGMPLVCDPGSELVKKCYEEKIKVEIVPGPCALISALALSGMVCSRFTFYGFLPVNKGNRNKALEFLKTLPHMVVFYEAPHKLIKTLKDLLSFFGDREIVVVKEITKIHETVILNKLSKMVEYFEEKEKPKGEFVLILKGAEETPNEEKSLEDILNFAQSLINEGEKTTTAAKLATKNTNFKKNDIYKKLINSSKK